jgi:5-methylcytosine-specific restriction endonuclease McrA
LVTRQCERRCGSDARSAGARYCEPCRLAAVRETKRVCTSKRRERAEVRAYDKAYAKSDAGRAIAEKFRNSESRKASLARYNKSEKRARVQRRYNSTEKSRATLRRFARSWKGKICAQHSTERRRARKLALPCTLTREDWQRICDRFFGVCVYCLRADGTTIDHIIPISSPVCPGHVPENVVPACPRCNASKHIRDWPHAVARPSVLPTTPAMFLQRLLAHR